MKLYSKCYLPIEDVVPKRRYRNPTEKIKTFEPRYKITQA